MQRGETPNVYHGAEGGYKRLFYSRPEIALRKEVTLQAGYGILAAGTVLAINKSAAGGVNKYVPYNKTVPSSADVNQKGRAFLVSDQGASADVYVTMEDSYKFAVGDDIIIGDANTTTTSTENLGVITAIDRTTYTHMAKITATTPASGGTFTVAQSAYISVEAGGDNTNNYSDAVGILENTVDTGTGENAVGGLGSMLISNAILYYGLLPNIDAAAITDLSATYDARFLYLK